MKITKWIKKDKSVDIKYEDGKLIIKNNSSNESKIFAPKLLRWKFKFLNATFKGKVLEGSGALLTFINRRRVKIAEVILNSETSSNHPVQGLILPVIVIKPHTTIEISEVSLTATDSKVCIPNKYLGNNDYLVITPLYPSPDNLYACAFVHSRVKAYREAGINVDVASVYHSEISSYYEIDGIGVYKTDYSELRSILMAKKYKAIFVHFFDEEYAHYLDTSYLKNTPIFLWNHGADILYWDYKDIYTPYFKDEYELPKNLMSKYKKRDQYVSQFSKMENVNWIFVSNSERKRAEELNNTEYNNAIVIPNIIDSVNFNYEKKDSELRKKIFMVRRFDNTKKYAIDIAVLTILELSRRPFFDDLEFFICGEGDFHGQLVEPLLKFKNVHIIKNFLSHTQLADLHKKCGIALFPTRQDTQGVSALEAASSGLAVVTSDLDVIQEYFDEKLGTICPVEDFRAYADVIEKLYNDPKEFQRVSKGMAEHTRKLCSKEKTTDKEIEYIKDNTPEVSEIILPVKKVAEEPLLTVVVPSYNASKFLDKCLQSLLQSKYAYLTEILVINDGSKDRTKEIGLEYEKLTTKGNRSIVKLIDKENGGHGSGINKGIELARGKYFKVVDSDDWLEVEPYDKLLEKLQTEDVDLVLTDYSEARSFESKPYSKNFYKFLTPDVVYNLNDICVGVYGFQEWGPSLPTATYKTECLRKSNFKLLEKTFYVDMLYNAYSLIYIETVKRYDLNIYRYYVGNVGQSISREGMMRNYKHHENVILELMNIATNDKRFTEQKRQFVINKLLLPMVNVQYDINLELFMSREKFMTFERRIHEFPSLLSYPEFNTRRIKLHRRTAGLLIRYYPAIRRRIDFLRRGKNKLARILKRRGE